MSKLGSQWNRGRRILFRNGNRIRVKFRVSVDCNLSQLDRAFRSQRERAAAAQVELDASSQARFIVRPRSTTMLAIYAAINVEQQKLLYLNYPICPLYSAILPGSRGQRSRKNNRDQSNRSCFIGKNILRRRKKFSLSNSVIGISRHSACILIFLNLH